MGKLKMSEAKIVDITPPSEPISVARVMVNDAPGCIATLSVLVRADGTMVYNSCGHERKDVLWALTRMIHELMEGE